MNHKKELIHKLTTLHSSADALVAHAEADRAIIKFTLAAFPDIAEAYSRVPKKFV